MDQSKIVASALVAAIGLIGCGEEKKPEAKESVA